MAKRQSKDELREDLLRAALFLVDEDFSLDQSDAARLALVLAQLAGTLARGRA